MCGTHQDIPPPRHGRTFTGMALMRHIPTSGSKSRSSATKRLVHAPASGLAIHILDAGQIAPGMRHRDDSRRNIGLRLGQRPHTAVARLDLDRLSRLDAQPSNSSGFMNAGLPGPLLLSPSRSLPVELKTCKHSATDEPVRECFSRRIPSAFGHRLGADLTQLLRSILQERDRIGRAVAASRGPTTDRA